MAMGDMLGAMQRAMLKASFTKDPKRLDEEDRRFCGFLDKQWFRSPDVDRMESVISLTERLTPKREDGLYIPGPISAGGNPVGSAEELEGGQIFRRTYEWAGSTAERLKSERYAGNEFITVPDLQNAAVFYILSKIEALVPEDTLDEVKEVGRKLASRAVLLSSNVFNPNMEADYRANLEYFRRSLQDLPAFLERLNSHFMTESFLLDHTYLLEHFVGENELRCIGDYGGGFLDATDNPSFRELAYSVKNTYGSSIEAMKLANSVLYYASRACNDSVRDDFLLRASQAESLDALKDLVLECGISLGDEVSYAMATGTFNYDAIDSRIIQPFLCVMCEMRGCGDHNSTVGPYLLSALAAHAADYELERLSWAFSGYGCRFRGVDNALRETYATALDEIPGESLVVKRAFLDLLEENIACFNFEDVAYLRSCVREQIRKLCTDPEKIAFLKSRQNDLRSNYARFSGNLD